MDTYTVEVTTTSSRTCDIELKSNGYIYIRCYYETGLSTYTPIATNQILNSDASRQLLACELFDEHENQFAYVITTSTSSLYIYQTVNGGIVCNKYSLSTSVTVVARAFGDLDCYNVTTADGTRIITTKQAYSSMPLGLYGYSSVRLNPRSVTTELSGTYSNGDTVSKDIVTSGSYNMRNADISIVVPEIYFTESANDQNILHVPMESTSGTVITGETQSVQIPSSALLEVAQPKAPADVTIKYSGTSVPVVSNTPASRSRKKVT